MSVFIDMNTLNGRQEKCEHCLKKKKSIREIRTHLVAVTVQAAGGPTLLLLSLQLSDSPGHTLSSIMSRSLSFLPFLSLSIFFSFPISLSLFSQTSPSLFLSLSPLSLSLSPSHSPSPLSLVPCPPLPQTPCCVPALSLTLASAPGGLVSLCVGCWAMFVQQVVFKTLVWSPASGRRPQSPSPAAQRPSTCGSIVLPPRRLLGPRHRFTAKKIAMARTRREEPVCYPLPLNVISMAGTLKARTDLPPQMKKVAMNLRYRGCCTVESCLQLCLPRRRDGFGSN